MKLYDELFSAGSIEFRLHSISWLWNETKKHYTQRQIVYIKYDRRPINDIL